MLLVCSTVLLVVFGMGAQGDDHPPEKNSYLVWAAESGTFGETTLTLTGMDDYLLGLAETPEFFAGGIPTYLFLSEWNLAGDSVAPPPGMLQVGELTVAFDVTMLAYDSAADIVSFSVSLDGVFDAGKTVTGVEPPGDFAAARLVLRMDSTWLDSLYEQAILNRQGLYLCTFRSRDESWE